ncbi:hypothetical protein F4861DRAFT_189354 [Xylaria intraflava]|nr:hypothetical protein F4861DRAFT_189354 [Xylaria intraflava]
MCETFLDPFCPKVCHSTCHSTSSLSNQSPAAYSCAISRLLSLSLSLSLSHTPMCCVKSLVNPAFSFTTHQLFSFSAHHYWRHVLAGKLKYHQRWCAYYHRHWPFNILNSLESYFCLSLGVGSTNQCDDIVCGLLVVSKGSEPGHNTSPLLEWFPIHASNVQRTILLKLPLAICLTSSRYFTFDHTFTPPQHPRNLLNFVLSKAFSA